MALIEIPSDDGVTKNVVLMCDGLCGRFQPHRFARRQPVEDPDNKDGLYFALIFECEQCGDERVFGTEEGVVQ